MTTPLAGKRILVPPSRLGLNPLIHMLERQGAEVPVFPALARETVETGALDSALAALDTYGFLVVAGEGSAETLLSRLEAAQLRKDALPPVIAAIGQGAVVAFRKAGVQVTHRPRYHFASGVADNLGAVQGRGVLCLREAGTSGALPALLAARGARVTALVGHALSARATLEEARQALGRPLDAVALANPATVRFFVQALADLGLAGERCLGAVPMVAVGPATAEAALREGLPVDLVGPGRLKGLQETLVGLLGNGRRDLDPEATSR